MNPKFNRIFVTKILERRLQTFYHPFYSNVAPDIKITLIIRAANSFQQAIIACLNCLQFHLVQIHRECFVSRTKYNYLLVK